MRKRKNDILMVKNQEGKCVTDRKGIQDVMMEFFGNIFRTNVGAIDEEQSSGSYQFNAPLLRISPQQADDLQQQVSSQEIRQAVMQMSPLKAPGPDGIPAIFYQRHWNLVGPSVTAAVQYFFDNGHILREWNSTLICLIPKVAQPEEASQFRPISLCNVLYKIVSKVLVNRLKNIIQDLVSPIQNAFVPGRLMSDNCLIAHELVRRIKMQKKGKVFMAALKVDMYKAYDKVDWRFLNWLLEKMDFPQKFRNWIMQCVTTVSYSLLINGEPSRKFKPSCGLKQGDPLSPYLFILVMEAFSRLITHVEAQGLLEGIKISHSSPSISHIFFADDSLLFFKANPQSCASIKNIIKEFSSLSGEVINFSKSVIMFSPNTPQKFKRYLRSIIGTQSSEEVGKYLGNDIEVDDRSSTKFQQVVDKVRKKVGDWSSLTLSHVGKILFINAILASMCQHVLSYSYSLKRSWRALTKHLRGFYGEIGVRNRVFFGDEGKLLSFQKE